jgi:peptidoglycan L-alanyl-D-glutamate endopeptidase CwlK
LKLAGVHADLAAVVKKAAEITGLAFIVTEGVRTLARQQQLVKAGASRTLNSRHITGHAVDLCAVIDFDGDGDIEPRYDWPLYFTLAQTMRLASRNRGIALEWGGCWSRIDNTDTDVHDLQDEYVKRCREKSKRPFLDGPHFQLAVEVYP